MIKNTGERFGDTLTVTVVVQACGQVQVAGTKSSVTSAHDLIAGKASGNSIGTGAGPLLNIGSTDFYSLQARALDAYSAGRGDPSRDSFLSV